MLKREEAEPHAEITPAFSCAFNGSIINKNRYCLDLPTCMYVNNALMLAVNRPHMETVLATAIEAIFVMMGKPEVVVRQCPLAMDKWSKLFIGPR